MKRKCIFLSLLQVSSKVVVVWEDKKAISLSVFLPVKNGINNEEILKNENQYKLVRELGSNYMVFEYAQACWDTSFITVLWPQQKSLGCVIKTWHLNRGSATSEMRILHGFPACLFIFICIETYKCAYVEIHRFFTF